jgi:hypothetical protein
VPVAEDHVLLAGRIAERLRDAGLAVDVVHGGSAALTLAGVTAPPAKSTNCAAGKISVVRGRCRARRAR